MGRKSGRRNFSQRRVTKRPRSDSGYGIPLGGFSNRRQVGRGMILTVTLNAAVARTLVVPSLTLGHRHRAPESMTLAGGKGVNVARSLRTLDVPVLAAGFAGGRNGDALPAGLSEAAIPFDLVEIEGYSRASTAIIDPMAGTQTEINEYGPEVTAAEAREFSRRLEYLMEYATAVLFAGSVPPNLDESFLVGLLRRARERGIYTVVDSPPSVLRAALKANPSLVSPNQVEAVSTVGSGDAYLAGLLAGLLHRNLAPAEAVRLAAGCAAANAESLGAGLFEARRAEELADSVQVEVSSVSLQESRT